MDEQTNNNHRVRINAAQDAKGFYKLEATAEFDTVEEAAKNVAAALLAAQASITAAGFKVIPNPLA